jgi:hypothetical protein
MHFINWLPEFGPFCIKIIKFLIAQISQQHGKSKIAPHGRMGKIASFYAGTIFSECSGGGGGAGTIVTFLSHYRQIRPWSLFLIVII